MSGALRDAVLGSDPHTIINGCHAACYLRKYDLIPALINAAEDDANPHADLAAETVFRLSQLLYDELAGPRDYSVRRNPQLARARLVTSLEASVKKFAQHRRSDLVTAFLILTKNENVTLKKILGDPHDAAYLTVLQLLTNSAEPGVMRVALGYLDDPFPPSSIVNVLSRRQDVDFVRHLFNKIGFQPSPSMRANLKHMDKQNKLGVG